MGGLSSTLSDRQAIWAFALGCVAVTLGVCAHLPMFAMARAMHYRLAGMPMDAMMIGGMGLIVGALVVAALYMAACARNARRYGRASQEGGR